MNAQTVAKFLNLSPEKTTALEKAWSVASTAAAGVNSREDAMKVLAEKNIGDDVLEKAVGYLNSPVASIASKMTGIDIDRIRSDINSLRSNTSASQSFTGMQSKDIDTQMDILKRGLQQLK